MLTEINEFLELSGMTQYALADSLGLDRGSINHFVNKSRRKKNTKVTEWIEHGDDLVPTGAVRVTRLA